MNVSFGAFQRFVRALLHGRISRRQPVAGGVHRVLYRSARISHGARVALPAGCGLVRGVIRFEWHRILRSKWLPPCSARGSSMRARCDRSQSRGNRSGFALHDLTGSRLILNTALHTFARSAGSARRPALWFAFRKAELLVCASGSEHALPLCASLEAHGLTGERSQYLGLYGEAHCYAVAVAERTARRPKAGGSWA